MSTSLTRAATLAALLVAASGPVPAQPQAPAAAASAPAYRSAFEGYRGFKDQPAGAWREANDQVLRIGGWKTYAREAAAPRAAASAALPASAASAAGGHRGHGHP